jgi:hypothetical protein
MRLFSWSSLMVMELAKGGSEEVNPSTASRNDMSVFRVDVWTHDVAAIPAVRWLAVPEPGYGNKLEVSAGRRRPRTTGKSISSVRRPCAVSRRTAKKVLP